MGNKMSNAPVYYAIAQVRFNTLAALETYIPAIQEGLRKNYPDFGQHQIAQITFGAQMPKSNVINRYHFLDAKRMSGFVLDQSWVSFQTTDYDTFEPFLSEFLKGLTVVNSEVGLSYFERVGIRFLDAVCPLDGESPSMYLQPSVLGLAEQLVDRDLVHTVSETRTTSGKTTLVGRAIIHKQETEGVAFPEDLQPVALQLANKFSKLRGVYGIIDTDSWLDSRENFDVADLERILRLLHDDIRHSFDLMVTPHALKVWS